MVWFKRIVEILLLLYAINICGLYPKVSILIAMVLVIYVISNRTIKKSKMTLLVILFGVTYLVFSSVINGENINEKVYQIILLYFFGAAVTRSLLDRSDYEEVFNIVLTGCIGFGLYGILTTLFSSASMSDTRRLVDIWSPDSVVAATQITAWIVAFLAIIPWFIFNIENQNVIKKIAIMILSILASISLFILSSRTGLLVLVLVVVMTLYYVAKVHQTKTLRRMIGIIIAGLLGFGFNIFGIQDKFWNSNLMMRIIFKSANGGVFETSRTESWLYVLSHWTDYMFGGYHYSSAINMQIHSMILDLYDQVGIIVTLLFIVIIIKTVFNLIIIVKNNVTRFPMGLGLSILFCLMLIVLFSEPVWYYGKSNYVAFFFFIIAVIEYISLNIISYRNEGYEE